MEKDGSNEPGELDFERQKFLDKVEALRAYRITAVLGKFYQQIDDHIIFIDYYPDQAYSPEDTSSILYVCPLERQDNVIKLMERYKITKDKRVFLKREPRRMIEAKGDQGVEVSQVEYYLKLNELLKEASTKANQTNIEILDRQDD